MERSFLRMVIDKNNEELNSQILKIKLNHPLSEKDKREIQKLQQQIK